MRKYIACTNVKEDPMHKRILALLAALVMMVAALPAMATELTDE